MKPVLRETFKLECMANVVLNILSNFAKNVAREKPNSCERVTKKKTLWCRVSRFTEHGILYFLISKQQLNIRSY